MIEMTIYEEFKLLVTFKLYKSVQFLFLFFLPFFSKKMATLNLVPTKQRGRKPKATPAITRIDCGSYGMSIILNASLKTKLTIK